MWPWRVCADDLGSLRELRYMREMIEVIESKSCPSTHPNKINNINLSLLSLLSLLSQTSFVLTLSLHISNNVESLERSRETSNARYGLNPYNEVRNPHLTSFHRGTICQHYRHRAVVRPAVRKGNLRGSATVRLISASAGGRSIANGAIRRNAATMPTGGDSVSGSWRNIRCARTAASMAERRSRSRSTTSGKLRTLLTSGWSRTPVCRSVSAVTVCGRAGASSPGMGSRHEARPRKTARAAARKSNGQTV